MLILLDFDFSVSYQVEDQEKCNSSPCINGGTCINVGHSYRCECTQGFYGRQCQFGKTAFSISSSKRKCTRLASRLIKE